jgi:RES domain-containing protein
MSEFLSWRSYWDYSKNVKQENRYIHNKKVLKFLQSVEEIYSKQKILIKKGINLWRAQVGFDWAPIWEGKKIVDYTEGPLMPTMMKPKKNQSFEGRINPKGIPYLYLATDKETAMSEVRPWIGSFVSVGQFKIRKDLKLVNCSIKSKNHKYYLNEPDDTIKRESVMSDIDEAFTKPVLKNEETAEYAPTQILGELFKNSGFDGILYSSALGKGKNIVLFNINSARMINCFLFEVKSISYEFSEAANPYFVRK